MVYGLLLGFVFLISAQGVKMTKDDFVKLVESTSFDSATKQLFMTSFCIGYDQGKLDNLKEVIIQIDKMLLKHS